MSKEAKAMMLMMITTMAAGGQAYARVVAQAVVGVLDNLPRKGYGRTRARERADEVRGKVGAGGLADWRAKRCERYLFGGKRGNLE